MHTTINLKIRHALLIKPDAIRKIWDLLTKAGYDTPVVTAHCNDESQFTSNTEEFLAYENYDDRRIESFSIEAKKGIMETFTLAVGDRVFGTILSSAALRISTSDEKTGIYLREQIMRIFKNCKPSYSIATRLPIAIIVPILVAVLGLSQSIKKFFVSPQSMPPLPLGWDHTDILNVQFVAIILIVAFCHFVLDKIRVWAFPRIVLLIGKQAENYSNRSNWLIGIVGSIIATIIIAIVLGVVNTFTSN